MNASVAAARCTFMPRLLPDEHIVSTLVRGIKLGIVNDWRTLVSENQREGGELCSGHVLRPLYAATANQYSALSAPDILFDHSLWRYYRSFLPGQPKLVPDTNCWDRLYNHTHILHPMKLVRYRQAKQWRWCKACNQEDYEQYGTCLWNVKHQLPGVSHCLKHPDVALQSGCSACRHLLRDISVKSVKLRPQNRCPSCGDNMGESEPFPQHPFIDWIRHISTELFVNEARFDIHQARTDILDEVGVTPSAIPTLAQNKRTSSIRKTIQRALPLDVINWLFKGQSKSCYTHNEVISPLCLRQLYRQDSFIHPLSWLAICWIVLSRNGDLQRYVAPWPES